MDEIEILRDLAKRTAEVASNPINENKKRLWKKLNALKPERPMVMLDQLPWHELNCDGELTLACEDALNRELEFAMRKQLFRFKHFPCDMVVENYFEIPSQVKNLGFGIKVKEKTRALDEKNVSAISHEYIDVLKNEEDAMKIEAGTLEIDVEAQRKYDERYHAVFDGIMELRPSRIFINAALWDRIAELKPITECLYAIIDEPELIFLILERLTAATLAQIDQLEKLNMLKDYNPIIHCTGGYTEWKNENGNGDNAQNSWIFGMSQMLSTVSPAMHEEFEVPYLTPIFKRFGNVYYGCCEPLHDKIDMIRKYPNVKKISMSPWADLEIGAERIGGDYVVSNKPNPAFLASGTLDEAMIEKSLKSTCDICRKTASPLEIIQKDVSTVSYNLAALEKWAQIAMRVVGA